LLRTSAPPPRSATATTQIGDRGWRGFQFSERRRACHAARRPHCAPPPTHTRPNRQHAVRACVFDEMFAVATPRADSSSASDDARAMPRDARTAPRRRRTRGPTRAASLRLRRKVRCRDSTRESSSASDDARAMPRNTRTRGACWGACASAAGRIRSSAVRASRARGFDERFAVATPRADSSSASDDARILASRRGCRGRSRLCRAASLVWRMWKHLALARNPSYRTQHTTPSRQLRRSYKLRRADCK
jgi:hypothetical protein